MSFDVPKVVRSPGCDHGHDEESRNGRYIKIDILDDYIRTPEVFSVISEKTGVLEGYRKPPPLGELMGLLGHSGGEEAGHRRCRAPPCPNPNWTRGGGAAPLFPSPSLSLPLSLSV